MRSGLDMLLEALKASGDKSKKCDCLCCKIMTTIDELIDAEVKSKTKTYLDVKENTKLVSTDKSFFYYTGGALAYAQETLERTLNAYATKRIIMEVLKEEKNNG